MLSVAASAGLRAIQQSDYGSNTFYHTLLSQKIRAILYSASYVCDYMFVIQRGTKSGMSISSGTDMLRKKTSKITRNCIALLAGLVHYDE